MDIHFDCCLFTLPIWLQVIDIREFPIISSASFSECITLKSILSDVSDWGNESLEPRDK